MSKLRVLMFGWEFPPFNSGGLGVACHGLTAGLNKEDVDITFVLPKTIPVDKSTLNVRFADDKNLYRHVNLHTVDSLLTAYTDHMDYNKRLLGFSHAHPYGGSLIEEVWNYAARARSIALTEEFDLIHAHDWLTFAAGLAAKHATGKPLIAHVHNTIFDRALGKADPREAEIEYQGIKQADYVIAVSEWTKNILIDKYGINADKIEVIHNGINQEEIPEITPELDFLQTMKNQGQKMILFMGRATVQKGIDYLIPSFAEALKRFPNMFMVVAGDGESRPAAIRQAAKLGIGDKVFFPGFLRGDKRNRVYHMADVFVMPSVSEPFGLVALEAVSYNTPTIVSKQSGAGEVLPGSLKVDFWDVKKLGRYIAIAASDEVLRKQMLTRDKANIAKLSWRDAAKKCKTLYQKMVNWLAQKDQKIIRNQE